MEFREVLRRRRMVRAFEQRPVPREIVDRLLDAARRAPTAGFAQGVDFVVLDTPEAVGRFWALTDDPGFPMEPEEIAAGPPVVVLAFSDPARYLARYSEPDKIGFGLDRAEAWPVAFWDTDTAMACMVLLLAAVDEGLGAWFFGATYGEAELRTALGVPEDRNLIGIVGLGYADPAERQKGSGASRPRRPFDEQVHPGRW
jgi:nitroreductase